MKNIIKKVLLIATLTLSAASAYAVDTDCSNIYPNGDVPNEVGDELCFNHYAVIYSSFYKTGLISAEHLTADDIKAAATIKRSGSFFADKQVASAKPSQYTHTGMQRGHLTPSADMPDTASQHQSYDMVNVTPETKQFNEVVWERIERNVRQQILDKGEAYIITAPIFAPTPPRINGIAVPKDVAKVVYFPGTKECEVFVVSNTDVPYTQTMRVSDFNSKYYRDYFTKECQ